MQDEAKRLSEKLGRDGPEENTESKQRGRDKQKARKRKDSADGS